MLMMIGSSYVLFNQLPLKWETKSSMSKRLDASYVYLRELI